MNDAENNEQGSTLGINDVLFIIFRHKFKILFFFLMAFVAAGAVRYLKPPLFESEAKLLIKYVKENRMGATAASSEVIVDGKQGITGSEIEILKSQDVAIAAARGVGPDKILAAYGGGSDEMAAAGVILQNLKIEGGNNNEVVTVTLGHPDPQVAQKALSRFIEEYLHKHYQAWLETGSYEFLLTKTDELRATLSQTDEELSKELSKAGIISLADAKTEISTQLNRIHKDLYDAEAQLAEKRAQFDEYRRQPEKSASTNGTSTGMEPKNNSRAESGPDPATVANYQRLAQQLATLKNRELEFLSVYREGSTNSSNPLRQVRQQIADAEKAISELGFDPSRTLQIATPTMALLQPGDTFNFALEKARIAAVEARARTLTNQLAEVNQKARRLEEVESRIEDLQRKKRIYEDQYQHFRISLEKAKIDQAIDSTKLGNINVVQEPSRASLNTKKTKKMVLTAFGGTAAIGLALAFLIELILDPSVKRAKEVESRVKVPVLISIPRFKGLRLSRKQLGQKADALEKKNGATSEFYGEIPPWEDSDPMLPYYEALRDRVVMSYNGDNHKPKVVGLTSCNDGAGVTRLATGLAAALSRDVQRNVLLIGLQSNRVSVSAFDKGRPAEALAGSSSDNNNAEDPSVQENLYSLATTGRNLAGASVVQSFSDLMPKLKVSDYDFIIFDLPPISQTSGALRLASQMERTIMVVEAEKTDRRKVQRAVRLLASSRAKVSTVFNKSRSYGPKVLDDEI
jgi:uncharacterized protein involved in exopolysaccharide biosynthesis/Mrp family chromosome partitioning ATPase